MWAVLVVLAALTVQVWWTCREIRSHFAERGMEVRRVRWLPFARRDGTDGPRWRMTFRVEYLDAQGRPGSCLALPTLRHGLSIVEGEPVRAVPPPLPGVAAPARSRAAFAWVSIAVAASCCLLAGVPYWTVPYAKLSLPDGLFGPGLVLAGSGAAALQCWRAERWRATLLTITASMVAVVAVRIVMDVMRDSSSHNLLPFELAIAGFCGAAVAGAGIGVGSLLRRCLGVRTAR